jgi:hypothetical protein
MIEYDNSILQFLKISKKNKEVLKNQLKVVKKIRNKKSSLLRKLKAEYFKN